MATDGPLLVRTAHTAAHHDDRSRAGNIVQLVVGLVLLGFALATIALAVMVVVVVQLAAASH